MSRPLKSSSARRGFILVAVLVIVGSALLVTTSLLFFAQAEVAGSQVAENAAQSRALSWSGLQVVAGELSRQRERILEGELPRLDRQYTMYEAGSRNGVVRLIPVTPGRALLAPEAGKIDLEIADRDMLAATNLIDLAQAEQIIEHRATLSRPYQSVPELLEVPGVTMEQLYGPLDELTVMEDTAWGDRDVTERLGALHADETPRGLADVVTVWGVEPALQRSGRLRINLNVPWSEALGERLTERFDEGAARYVRGLIEGGTALDSDARIVEILVRENVETEIWREVLDAITTESGDYHFGRVDINSASQEVLAALPGIDPEQAAQIVRQRADLSAEDKATIVWPIVEEILEREAYLELAGRITTRSWTFRVRLAAGEVDADEPESDLIRPVIYEAVIDLSAPQARIASLRDITLLQTYALVASAHGTSEEEEAEDADEGDRAARDSGEDDPSNSPDDSMFAADDTDARRDEGLGEEPDDQPPDDQETGLNLNMLRAEEDDDAGATLPSSSPAPDRERQRMGRWRRGD